VVDRSDFESETTPNASILAHSFWSTIASLSRPVTDLSESPYFIVQLQGSDSDQIQIHCRVLSFMHASSFFIMISS
jgi:hypothetical protein